MTEHAPKVALPARTPQGTLDALMPMATNAFGTDIKTNRELRLRRIETVDLDFTWDKEITFTRTLWTLEYKDRSSYQTTPIAKGHFHTGVGADFEMIVGFCPNETLPFKEVNEYIANLTKETANAR